MRKSLVALLTGLVLSVTSAAAAHAAPSPAAPKAVKEWTMLVFLNGKNNLDRYGAININQMEQVGSTDDVNVVVQWASSRNGATKRLLVKADNDTHKVTSPIVQDMGAVDMGDWRSVVEFVKWAHENYPAKRYFLDVWNHGSGWHELGMRGVGAPSPAGAFFPMDISFDDETGNSMNTVQLGQALAESAKVIGHKIDLYASDACLMAMAEVAAEMSDSVEIFAGSEEVEPAAGWPYQKLLGRWAQKPAASAAEVARILTEEYIDSYTGGVNGNQDVTFSAFNLGHMGKFNSAIAGLGQKLLGLDASSRGKVVKAMSETQNFTYSDYGDLGDFLNLMNATRAVDAQAIAEVRGAMKDFVVANGVTPRYAKSEGVAMWLPSAQRTYDNYVGKYKQLKFEMETHWSEALQYVLQDATQAPALR